MNWTIRNIFKKFLKKMKDALMVLIRANLMSKSTTFKCAFLMVDLCELDHSLGEILLLQMISKIYTN